MKSFALAFALATLPAVAHGAQLALLCEIQSQSSQGWIAPQIAIVVDQEAGTALVNDTVTIGTTGGPVVARVATQNDRRIVVAWEVRGRDTRGQIIRASYRATIRKADNVITVSMRPLGYDNSFRARGTCTAG